MVVAKLNDIGVLVTTGNLPQSVNYAVKKPYVSAFLSNYPEVVRKLRTGGSKSASFEDSVRRVIESVVLIEVW